VTQKTKTLLALNYISTLIDVSFIEKNSAATLNTINFASNKQIDSAGYASFPSEDFGGSDLFLDLNSDNTTLADGTYGALTLIHEIGHALGLKHPFSHPQAGGGIAESPYLSGSEEKTSWTVMSYQYSSSEYYLRYGPLDIAALQYLYGPSKLSRTGNDKYIISSNTTNFIWDGAGTDLIDASSVYQAATIYLTPGYQGYLGPSKSEKITSAGQITVNFGTVIENLMGSNYDDHLYGNEVGNKIEGGSGNDSIEGWDGTDTLIGGAGNDFLTGGSGDDSIEGGDGNDTLIVSGLSYDYIVKYDSKTLSYSIQERTGNDGKDTFKTIEFLKFTDKTVSLQSYDFTPPSISVSSNVGALANGKIASINFLFSESVSDFTLSDVVVTGGVLSNFTGSGSKYTATFTPTSNFTGSGSVKVASGTFTDYSGNSNEDGDDTNNFLSFNIDTQVPVAISYSPVDEGTKVRVASDIVIEFNEVIQKGTGSVSIKTDAGATVATYDIQTSANLVFSGTSITVNPSSNLSFDTGYRVEITAGAIKDSFGNENQALTSYNFTTVSSIVGTSTSDVLNGTAYEDSILGSGGNDTITGGFGDDIIDGGIGIDTVKFSASYSINTSSNYLIKSLNNGRWSVSYNGPLNTIYTPSSNDGLDTLMNIERIKFTETSFALDLSGNAGITAKILGAIFGKDAVSNKNFVGIGLSFLDAGWSYDNLAALALDAAGAKSNDQIVSLLWANVIGVKPTAADMQPFIALLENGMTAGALAHLAADTSLNATNINLVGLAQTGIEYLPV
jgi:Ca2+-binding RTX toxin-like protein